MTPEAVPESSMRGAGALAGRHVHDTAVRLRHHRAGGDAAAAQRCLEGIEIGRDPRMHVAVENRRRGALVLADDGPDLARGEDEELGR